MRPAWVMSMKSKRTVLQDMTDEVTSAAGKRMWNQAGMDMQVAQLIYNMRNAAGLTQRELAKRVGTTASVICRLEQPESGHSFRMLSRIADALDRRIELRSVPDRRRHG